MTRPDYSRREFLQSTAAAAVVGWSTGLRANETAVSPTPLALRWGIIGCGARGALAHIPGIQSVPGMEVVGVCDVLDAHLQRALKMAGGRTQGYTDYQKLFANPEIDAVVIATPGFLHREMLAAALDAGKHVLCEKPMGVSMEDGRTMLRAAEGTHRVVAFAMQLRFARYYQEVRRQIASGRIGQPTHLGFRLYRGDWNPRVWMYRDPKTGREINWRYSQAASGGIMAEEGCHYLDVLNWMADALPRSVHSAADISCYTRDGRDTWDHSLTTLKYPNGALGSLEMCLYGPSQLELRVIGESGALLGDIETQSLVLALKARGRREQIPTPSEVGHQFANPSKGARGVETAVTLMYQDFVASIQGNRRPLVDSTLAFAAGKTSWLADESVRRSKELAWSALD